MVSIDQPSFNAELSSVSEFSYIRVSLSPIIPRWIRLVATNQSLDSHRFIVLVSINVHVLYICFSCVSVFYIFYIILYFIKR